MASAMNNISDDDDINEVDDSDGEIIYNTKARP